MLLNISISDLVFQHNECEYLVASNNFKILVIDSNMTNPEKVSSFSQKGKSIEEQMQAKLTQIAFWMTLITNFLGA
jgi:hypothetical protein